MVQIFYVCYETQSNHNKNYPDIRNSKPVVDTDAKGVGPFFMAYIERLKV